MHLDTIHDICYYRNSIATNLFSGNEIHYG